jgi:hypothetical protein
MKKELTPTTTKDVFGYQLTDLQIMVFNNWCAKTNVALNTLTPDQRTQTVKMWADNINEEERPSPTTMKEVQRE